MTRKEVKEMLPVFQAYAEGKEIESLVNGKYYRVLEICNGMNPKDYRIKPEQKYRPFKDAEECWQEMQKRQPFGWVKTKDKGIIRCMSGLNQKSAFTQVGCKYDEAFDKFIFADGFPFGVKVEE